MSRYVLTGGPGVGKTTLIEFLATKRFRTVPEAARQIIEEEGLEFVDTVGWDGALAFQERIAERQLALEAVLPESSDPVFLDRGLIDGVAYCELDGIPVPPPILENARARYHTVFLLEFLGEYTMGPGRQDSPETARAIHARIADAYRTYGYPVVSVPAGDLEFRATFILDHLSQKEGSATA